MIDLLDSTNFYDEDIGTPCIVSIGMAHKIGLSREFFLYVANKIAHSGPVHRLLLEIAGQYQ